MDSLIDRVYFLKILTVFTLQELNRAGLIIHRDSHKYLAIFSISCSSNNFLSIKFKSINAKYSCRIVLFPYNIRLLIYGKQLILNY